MLEKKVNIAIVGALLHISSATGMHKKCFAKCRKQSVQTQLLNAIRHSKATNIPNFLLLGANTKSKKKL